MNRIIVCLVLGSMFTAFHSVKADPVPILNPGFDMAGWGVNIPGANPANRTTIPGWGTRTNGANISNDPDFGNDPYLYLNHANSRRQPLDGQIWTITNGSITTPGFTPTEATSLVTLEAGATYQLTFDVGRQDSNNATFGGHDVMFEVWNPVALTWEEVISSNSPRSDLNLGSNTWARDQVLEFTAGDTFMSTLTPGLDLMGQHMAIRLADFETVQSVFDNIRLDVTYAASAVPEPASVAAWGMLGLAALAFSRRRRKNT